MPVDKQKYLDQNFTYEVDMLMDANSFLNTQGSTQFLRNMGLETTLTHARSLLEFLYFDKKKKYIRAKDYLELELSFEDDTYAEGTYRRICAEIVHLGEARKEDSYEKRWENNTVVNFVLDKVGLFLNDTKAKGYYSDALEALEGRIKQYRSSPINTVNSHAVSSAAYTTTSYTFSIYPNHAKNFKDHDQ